MRAMRGTEGAAYTMILVRRKLEVLRNNLRGARQFVVNDWSQVRPRKGTSMSCSADG